MVAALLGGLCTAVAHPAAAATGPPGTPAAPTSTAGVLSASLQWSAPSSGGSPLTGYVITASTGAVTEVPVAVTRWVVDGLQPGSSVSFTVAARNAMGVGPPSPASAAVTPTTPGGAVHPLAPSRILDTRSGLGAPRGLLAAGQTLDLQVTGRGGVPATGVSAVVLNLTAVDAAGPTWVVAWPTGANRPTASNLNVAGADPVPNLVQVEVGAGGKVSLLSGISATDLVADVSGWVADSTGSATAQGLFVPLTPSRVLDTRDGTGAPAHQVGAGQSIILTVIGHGGVPATGVSAIALNLTATGPTASTYITAYPTGQTRPVVSNLNLVAGETRPNRVVVAVGSGGSVTLYNYAGSVDLVADVSGYYTDATDPQATGGWFTGMTPARVLDTRVPIGVPSAGKVGPGQSLSLTVAGVHGVPAMSSPVPPSAVVANVTVTEPTTAGWVAAWPSTQPRPLASDLNFTPGETVANLAVVEVGSDGAIELYNAFGATHLVVDVLGWYAGNVVRASNLHVLTDSEVAAVTAVDTDSVTFAGAPAGITGLQAGTVISAANGPHVPSGFLRHVVSTSTSAGQTVVDTIGASLSDAVIQGGIDQTVDLGPPPSSAPPPPSTPSSIHGPASTPAADVGFSQDFSVQPNPQTTVSGTVAAGASVDLALHIHPQWSPPFFHVDGSLTASVGESFDATLSVSAAADWSETTTVATLPFDGFVIVVAGVPVFVNPSIKLDLDTSAHLDGQVDLAASQHASATVGVTIAHGDVNPFSSIDDPAPSLTAQAHLGGEAKVELVPWVQLKFDDVGEIDEGLAPYLKIATDGCVLTPSVGVDLRFNLSLSWMDFELADWAPDTINLVDAPIAQIDLGTCSWSGEISFVYSETKTWTDASNPPYPSGGGNYHDVRSYTYVVDGSSCDGPGSSVECAQQTNAVSISEHATDWCYKPEGGYGTVTTSLTGAEAAGADVSDGKFQGPSALNMGMGSDEGVPYLSPEPYQVADQIAYTTSTSDDCGDQPGTANWTAPNTFPAPMLFKTSLTDVENAAGTDVEVSSFHTTDGGSNYAGYLDDWKVLATFRFTRKADADHDGIPDSSDPNPNDPDPLPG